VNHIFSTEAYNAILRPDWPGRLFVVLKEPYPFGTIKKDALSYHSDRLAAISDADIYTLQTNRRAVVGLMRADIYKH